MFSKHIRLQNHNHIKLSAHYHEWVRSEPIILPSNNEYVFDQLLTTAEAKTCFDFKTCVFAYVVYVVGQVWYI